MQNLTGGIKMQIISLVENTSSSELKATHGLSLYIRTKNHKILFDLGPDNTLFENAERLNIDLSEIDIVIISHGHSDHGGGLKQFLTVNSAARIYVQKKAFEPHYSKALFFKIPIGLDNSLESNSQITLIDGDYKIDEELSLFTVGRAGGKCLSPANNVLYGINGRDDFAHEQNLVISEKQTALIMGCGHAGVVNIMDKAKAWRPDVCIGGFHLFNPVAKKAVPDTLLDEITRELLAYEQTQFYTCHCTRKKAYDYLSKQLPNLSYLSCGDSIEI